MTSNRHERRAREARDRADRKARYAALNKGLQMLTKAGPMELRITPVDADATHPSLDVDVAIGIRSYVRKTLAAGDTPLPALCLLCDTKFTIETDPPAGFATMRTEPFWRAPGEEFAELVSGICRQCFATRGEDAREYLDFYKAVWPNLWRKGAHPPAETMQ